MKIKTTQRAFSLLPSLSLHHSYAWNADVMAGAEAAILNRETLDMEATRENKAEFQRTLWSSHHACPGPSTSGFLQDRKYTSILFGEKYTWR